MVQKIFWTLFFSKNFSPMSGTLFFHTTKNFKTRNSTLCTSLRPKMLCFLAYYRVNISVGGCPYFFCKTVFFETTQPSSIQTQCCHRRFNEYNKTPQLFDDFILTLIAWSCTSIYNVQLCILTTFMPNIVLVYRSHV